ncbi:MAG: hypothetical protein ACRD0W_09210, partial [Acidimicrobiales bacterium]
VLDRVPLERISVEAREVHFARTVATLLAALLYLVGWMAAKAFTALWFAVAWSATAVKVGWVEARKPATGGG